MLLFFSLGLKSAHSATTQRPVFDWSPLPPSACRRLQVPSQQHPSGHGYVRCQMTEQKPSHEQQAKVLKMTDRCLARRQSILAS